MSQTMVLELIDQHRHGYHRVEEVQDCPMCEATTQAIQAFTSGSTIKIDPINLQNKVTVSFEDEQDAAAAQDAVNHINGKHYDRHSGCPVCDALYEDEDATSALVLQLQEEIEKLRKDQPEENKKPFKQGSKEIRLYLQAPDDAGSMEDMWMEMTWHTTNKGIEHMLEAVERLGKMTYMQCWR